jgi:hypothetical protein
MNSERTITLLDLPCKSQEFEQGPQVILSRRTVTLKCDYETPTGEYAWLILVFSGVHGFSFTRDYSCKSSQFDAYDKLVEVQSSSWVQMLLDRRPKQVPISPVKHYRIYFDNIGCYEIAAEKFDIHKE